MNRFVSSFVTVIAVFLLTYGQLLAAKPTDNDGDGYNSKVDCDDNNPSVYPRAEELCFDGIDNDCNGLVDANDEFCSGAGCVDADADGYGFPADPACTYAEEDCNDTLATINPGIVENCNNGIDDNCNGYIDLADPACTPGTSHAANSWADYPANCISCHGEQFNEMAESTHYRWVGDTTEMLNQNGTLQGKLTNSVNSYCINILGDWSVCGKCHVGRGLRPDDQLAGADNIDCLVCHNEAYALARTRLPDGSMGPGPAASANPTPAELATLDSYTRNVAVPTRVNCLKCHAFAGGGNGVKRGDLSMSGTDLYGRTLPEGTDNNSDPNFDVHMNRTSANLSCQDCHVFQNHKTIGRGSDLRPTDDLVRGSEVSCTTCHIGFDQNGGHAAAGANRTDADHHVARVACQSCHIDVYAKVPTETGRDWRYNHAGLPADGTQGPGHPELSIGENLKPVYLFWDRMSDNYLLGDTAEMDPATGAYVTSWPSGDINNGKLYPFKYKTAVQPMISDGKKLLALDTREYLQVSGDVNAAIESGLQNMGYPTNEPLEWVVTETFQLLNHGVAPAASVDCMKCHGDLDLSTDSELDLLGYKLKGPKSQVCAQCHREKNLKRSHTSMHNHVSKGPGMDCLFCHSFSRQDERGGISPCDPEASTFVDNVAFSHPECN